ncbi:sensor histidine kinase [Streptomyces sp. NPDC058001]|uniref:sensor histidine kinase n=1 Tax=Streptomyces sp. NPDC058001 TaxID=3346300 RepID=UPI0036EC9AAD
MKARPGTTPRRPRRITLRARLTLLYGGLFLVAGVVLLGLTYALFQQQLTGSGPQMIAGMYADDSGRPGAPGSKAPAGGKRDSDGVSPKDLPHTQIRTADGTVLTGDAAAKWLRDETQRLRSAATTSLITQGGIALGVVGAAAAGFGWLVAGRVLAPLHRVTDTARRIASAPAADRGLHERIALHGPDDEVKDLADTFDTMVERLDRSFDGQRRFVANASHELRTPLTLGRALVEVAMHRKTASDDVHRLGENLLEINARHERLISGLLMLASSENTLTERVPVDLADITAHVVAQLAPEARTAGVVVHEKTTETLTGGDALLLERLVHNLVENGIRHNTGDGHGWVRIVTRAREGRTEVEVSNTGPAVPVYEIPSLFEPFRRGGGDRLVSGRGAGLGLSIVRSIARAHDGEVTAHPRGDGGLHITVRLPN